MYLFIDTSEQGKVILKLASAKSIIASVAKTGTHKLTEKLVFFIEQFLKKNKMAFGKLKGIVVVTGPGSFTAVRVGCVVANTLAQVLKIGIFGAAKGHLDADRKILASLKRIKKGKYVIPYYDREPNITVAK